MKTFCAYFNAGVCDSCRLIELEPSEQLARKQARLENLLQQQKKINFLSPVPSAPLGFRNKAKLVVTGTVEQPIIGLPGADELDEGREITQCPVHQPVINTVINALPAFIQLSRLAPYQISQRKGELKGLIVYHSPETQETYLRFVLRSKESLDRIKKNLPGLIQQLPHLKCVSVNIQPIPHALLEGDEEIFLTEKKYIEHRLGKHTIHLHPQGFVQTNKAVAEKLYQTAADWIKELQIERFAELFCGQGAFSFMTASTVKEAVGFEVNSEAVNEANRSAQAQGLKHLTFKCSDAAKVGTELRNFAPQLVLVNPPRRGLGESVKLFEETQYPYLIYSSCSAETLAQDLRRLAPFYRPLKAQLFDMFPHTEHFETLVLLTSSET